MPHTSGNKPWLLAGLVATLIVGALAVGYLLPPNAESESEAKTSDPAEAAKPAEVQLAGVWADAAMHSFPLATADVRDSQETPSVAVDAKNRIHLVWGSQTGDDERTLYYTVSTDLGKTFAPPRELRKSGISRSVSRMKGKEVVRERRMSPHIAADGEKVLVAWSDAPADGSAIRLLMMHSTDGGQTFSEPQSVPQAENAGPTFTSLSVNKSGQVACSWLDNRNRAQQVHSAIRFAGSEQFSPELLVDAGQESKGVCPCCATAVKVADDETVVVAYRGSVDGHRDIWVSVKRPSDNQFSAPIAVVPPTWEFAGCPHDGPSLTLVGDTLHVSWMDARDGRQRAYRGWANLHDLKFQVEEINAKGPGTQGNTRLAVDAAGQLHAVWEESLADEQPAIPQHEHQQPATSGSGRAIVYAPLLPTGGQASQPIAIASQAGRFQTRPAIACGPAGLLISAWMELDESGKRVVVVAQPGKAAAGDVASHQREDSRE
jgi:hypothetical protein